jgi:hypothetical protein
MALSRLERERLTDSKLKIKSIANSLSQVDPEKVPDYEDIQNCLEGAEKSLNGALKAADQGNHERRN